jgi:small conductance mechanosensitive channel
MEAHLNWQDATTPVIKKVNSWGIDAVKMLPNLVVAIIVLVIFWLAAAMVARLAHRMTLRFSPYAHVARLVAGLSRLAVIAIGVILALSAMSLDKAVASMLAGVGIVGIALGFASKDIAGDYMAGLIIHFTHPYRKGHIIKTGDFFGYVDALEMRVTVCRTPQGQQVIIPNRNILDGDIINYSITGMRRVDITCGVSYADDLQVAEDLAKEAVEGVKQRNQDRPVELFYEEFGASGINFVIRFWTAPEQKIYLEAKSNAIKAIRKTFKENGITIPFQIVTLDFGIGGDASLKEQLEGAILPPSQPKNQAGGEGKTARKNNGPKFPHLYPSGE